MCGIIGIVAKNNVGFALYDALTVLQHRGQDAAGIATADRSILHLHKANGLVRDVFGDAHMQRLQGRIGIGHCRYPTAGAEGHAEAQPLYVNSPFGIALAHNGNLTNAEPLRQALFAEDRRHINTDSDSEILLNVLAHELQQCIESGEKDPIRAIFGAIAKVHERCVGGYSVVCLVLGVGLVAFRDPHGIRPLVLGTCETAAGTEYAVASESVALDVLGFRRVRDVAPGEAVVITEAGELRSDARTEKKTHAPCIFEYVYLARPDSIIENVSVYQARLRMGESLAKKIQVLRPDHDIDAVVPVPDTSCTAALALAQRLGIPYREGFIKNRYVGRTFIMPGQNQRVKSVRRKLNPIAQEFAGKVVLIVDDSIVRGTTSKQIIQMARDMGARKVYFASAAPPVRFPNIYGIDMPAPVELVAHGRAEEEIQALLACDWLIYQDLPDLIAAVQAGNPALTTFDTSCFSGEYVTGADPEYFARIAQSRSDQVKLQNRKHAS